MACIKFRYTLIKMIIIPHDLPVPSDSLKEWTHSTPLGSVLWQNRLRHRPFGGRGLLGHQGQREHQPLDCMNFGYQLVHVCSSGYWQICVLLLNDLSKTMSPWCPYS